MASRWDNPDGTRMQCKDEECARDVKVAGYCGKHYQRLYALGKTPAPFYKWTLPDGTRITCAELNCNEPVLAKALCSLHYNRMLAGYVPGRKRRGKWDNPDGSRKGCSEKGCGLPVKVKGYCSPHYHHFYKVGTDRERKPLPDCPVPGCDAVMANRSTMCGACNQTRWRYSIPAEVFLEMFRPENRHCSNKACGSTEKLHIDHDHSCCDSGKFGTRSKVSCGECVRGWLCNSCNYALGNVQDSEEKLLGLIKFLRDSKNPSSFR